MNSFPDYKHLLQENYVEYKLFFFKFYSTQRSFLENNLGNGKKICLYPT